MFGKVQEDSFQNIFDMSLEDNSFDSNSLGLGWGLGSNSTRNGSVFNSDSSSSIWSSSLSDEEEDLCYKKNDPLRLQSPSELFFSRTQLDQMQRLTLNDSAYGSPCISSPSSSTASSCSFDNFPTAKQQQRKLSPYGSKNIFMHSEDFGNFDGFSDTASSSSLSTSSSSSSTCSDRPSRNVSGAQSSGQSPSNRYKTELCRPFQENGSCKYGDKCQFAHGSAELRTVSRHPKYKTDLCRTYHSSGFCPYGPRCHFIHNLEESDNASSKGSNAGAKRTSKDKESVLAGPQLPMFSFSQRSSPISEFEETPSPYLAHSSVCSRPAPFGSATGDLLQRSGRSDAFANGGDAAANNQSYAARLPVFSTLVN